MMRGFLLFLFFLSGAAALIYEVAWTRTMVLVTHHDVGDPHPAATLSGVYHDIWKKTPRGWKLAQRILFTDGTG